MRLNVEQTKLVQIFLVSLLVSSCSGLSKDQGVQRLASKRLEFSRRWVRSSLQGDYLGFRPYHRMAPLLTDSLVIQTNGVDGLKIFDRKTASELYRLNIQHGSEGGADLGEGHLFFGASDGQLYAIDLDGFKIKWQFDLKAEGLARPLYHAGNIYVLGGNGVLHAVEAASGKTLWSYNRRDSSEYSIRGGARPLAHRGSLYLGFSDGYFVSLDLRSGQLQWETLLNKNKRFRDIDAEPVLEGERLFVAGFDASLFCLDRSSGEPLWSFEEGSHTGVLAADGRIYLSTSSGELISLDQGSGKKLWSKTLAGLPTTAEMFNGVLLIGSSEGPLLALSPRTGEELANYHPGRGVSASVTVDQDKNEIYFLSVDANIFALKLEYQDFSRRWSWQRQRELTY